MSKPLRLSFLTFVSIADASSLFHFGTWRRLRSAKADLLADLAVAVRDDLLHEPRSLWDLQNNCHDYVRGSQIKRKKKALPILWHASARATSSTHGGHSMTDLKPDRDEIREHLGRIARGAELLVVLTIKAGAPVGQRAVCAKRFRCDEDLS